MENNINKHYVTFNMYRKERVIDDITSDALYHYVVECDTEEGAQKVYDTLKSKDYFLYPHINKSGYLHDKFERHFMTEERFFKFDW